MENHPNVEIRRVKEAVEPRLVFPLGKGQVDLAKVLAPDVISPSRRDAVEKVPHDRTVQGDKEASQLISDLERSGVTIDEYRKTMPHLIDWSTNKEGGFDADFIVVARRMFDRTAMDMGIHERGFSPMQFRKGHSPKDGEYIPPIEGADRVAYFSRVYGKIEAIKSLIWDNPDLAEEKKSLVEHAKQASWQWYHDPLAD